MRLTRAWALVLLGCSLPLIGIALLGAPLPLDARGDALVHALAAAWLTWLALRILALTTPGGLLLGGLLAVAVALASEGAQELLTSTRRASLEDLLADGAGIAIALIGEALWLRRSARGISVQVGVQEQPAPAHESRAS